MLPLPRKALENMKALSHADDVQRRGDGVGFPDQLARVGIQAPDKAVIRALLSAIVATDVKAAIAGTEGAFRGDVVVGGLPDDLACARVHAAGQAIVAHGQATAAFAVGIIAEEDAVVELAIEKADAAVVTATSEIGEVPPPPFPTRACPFPGPRPRDAGDGFSGNTGCRWSR